MARTGYPIRYLATAKQDGPHVRIVLEIEPGSAGKAYFAHIKTLLLGYDVVGIRPTGRKLLRAEPLLAAYQRGGVAMLNGDWNKAFVQEMQSLPGGKHDDQLDSVAMGFNALVAMRDSQPMMTIM
jgi:predicted phage terminase large subunit-like protein